MGLLLVNMASWVPSILCRSGNRGFRFIRGLTNLTSSSGLKIEFQPFNAVVLKAKSNQNGALAVLNLARSLHQDVRKSAEEEQQHVAKATSEPEVDAKEEETFEEHEMTVYRGILSTQIKLVKSFSLMTSVTGLSCQPLLYLKMTESSGASLAFIAAGGAFLSFFTFATPLLIHWVSKKYVTEMLYNRIEITYTAVTYSFLLRRKQITFKASDVTIPNIPGMFTTFQVNGNSLFVDADSFQSAKHYGKLMGYDKPLDIRFKYERDEVEDGWGSAGEDAEKSKKK